VLDLFQPPAVEREARAVTPMSDADASCDGLMAPPPRAGYWRDYHRARSMTDPDYIERRRQRARAFKEKKRGE
jgi:hypothetical protein